MGMLVMAGYVLALIGYLIIVIAAFRESAVWGIGVLLVPIVSLIFVALNWHVARGGFVLYLAGVGLVIAGAFLGGGH